MAPLKFVIKCGNFAVLVDLHVLPLGGQEDASWFTTSYIEEVTTLVRDAVDQRVKLYTESFLHRKQPKHRKELAPASTFIVKGKNFNLVANFLNRHFNLRCIVKQLPGELRVFPERYVVCVSRPEDAAVHYGKLSPTTTELSEQSRSEYFSREGEIQESFNCATKIKKTMLQKIAKKASVQQEHWGPSVGEQQTEQRACVEKAEESERRPKESESNPPNTEQQVPFSKAASQNEGFPYQQQPSNCPPESINPNLASVGVCLHEISPGTRQSKRSKTSDAGEDPRPKKAKRTGLKRPPAAVQTHSSECFTQISKQDPLPLPPLPADETKAESTAFPVSEHKKTTVEVELLTPGKRDQRLPLISNNTAQTNQNRLATSLRGLSVKLASSVSSIGSRSTDGEEGSKNVPRTSRLRRQKRS
ncbi:protein SLX4IP [Dunckerocampus dactyliophorus]|uniref:protein SLX4IP n=1 Tax=Dunckerocampus dactyliophorus TaxID=161453 RepID=UPI00240670F5|nr:protein SLX4IP [Dunckerocampus dactyliophorus]